MPWIYSPAVDLIIGNGISLVCFTNSDRVGYGRPSPQARYSAGILAVMHSAEYLWIARYCARQEAPAPAQRGIGQLTSKNR